MAVSKDILNEDPVFTGILAKQVRVWSLLIILIMLVVSTFYTLHPEKFTLPTINKPTPVPTISDTYQAPTQPNRTTRTYP